MMGSSSSSATSLEISSARIWTQSRIERIDWFFLGSSYHELNFKTFEFLCGVPKKGFGMEGRLVVEERNYNG